MNKTISHNRSFLNRRDFIKLMAGALGVTLTVVTFGHVRAAKISPMATGYGSGRYGGGAYGKSPRAVFLPLVRK